VAAGPLEALDQLVESPPGTAKIRKLQVAVGGKDRRTVVFRRGYKGTPPAGPRAGG